MCIVYESLGDALTLILQVSVREGGVDGNPSLAANKPKDHYYKKWTEVDDKGRTWYVMVESGKAFSFPKHGVHYLDFKKSSVEGEGHLLSDDDYKTDPDACVL